MFYLRRKTFRLITHHFTQTCFVIALIAFQSQGLYSQRKESLTVDKLKEDLKENARVFWIPRRNALLHGTTIRNAMTPDSNYSVSSKRPMKCIVELVSDAAIFEYRR